MFLSLQAIQVIELKKRNLNSWAQGCSTSIPKGAVFSIDSWSSDGCQLNMFVLFLVHPFSILGFS